MQSPSARWDSNGKYMYVLCVLPPSALELYRMQNRNQRPMD